MPVPLAQQSLVNPGDILGPVILGNTGVGQPPDVSAVLSFTGLNGLPFTNAVIAVEAIAIGQPVTAPASFGAAPTPLNPGQWEPVLDIGLVDGQPVSSPIGPLTSAGTVGTGFGYTVPCAQFQQLRARLVSIGSGAIQGGIATMGFPAGSTYLAQLVALNSAQLLELQRIRVGIGVLVDTDLKDGIPISGSGA
jgi:hypothetical protein